MANENNTPTKKKRGIKFFLPLILVLMAIAAGAIYWYIDYNKYISTDDARVQSDIVSVSPKIMGRIIRLYVDEGDSVSKGMLLAELDSADLLSQKSQALAAKGQASTSRVQAEAKYISDQAGIKTLQVANDRAREDFDRAQKQFTGGVITQEQFDHAKKALEAAQAQLDAAKTQLSVSKAQIGTAGASIQTAQAQIGVIETQLKNTRIYAPMDGIVARRWLLPGDVAQPGQSVYTITNNRSLWVNVYLEETKLHNVHVDQKTEFTIDAFPGVTFYGKVISIGSNTASDFSLIPPNNASGNFTKVTQRVPIKVSIEGTDSGKLPREYHILSGMSVEIKILKAS